MKRKSIMGVLSIVLAFVLLAVTFQFPQTTKAQESAVVTDSSTKSDAVHPSRTSPKKRTTASTDEPVNIALNKEATASGQCNENETAEKALDGINWTKWCAQGAGSWLKVNLGKIYQLSEIRIQHGGVTESELYNTRAYDVQISLNGTDWTTIVSVKDNTKSITTHKIEDKSARYVKLVVHTPDNQNGTAVRIPELEVYGVPDLNADNTAPSAPANLRAVTKSTMATLTWDKSTDNMGVTDYFIYKGEDKIASVKGDATSYVVRGLTPSTSYDFTVRAADASGNLSANSNVLNVETNNGQFTVSGSKILDPNGEEFIINGVNFNGYNWVWPITRSLDDAVHYVKDIWNFNFVRVNNNIGSGSNQYQKDKQDLYDIIDKFTAAGVVVMVEAHDFSGSFYTDKSDPSLTDLKNFYKDLAERYKDNSYVWFNVMNEPSYKDDPLNPQWLTVHQAVIKTIRDDVGASNIIVADGAHFASDLLTAGKVIDSESAILTFGPKLLHFDGQDYKNIAFSMHMYDAWADGSAILPDGKPRFMEYIDKVRDKNLAIMIGEYGIEYNSPDTRVMDTITKYALPNDVGRVAWSWFSGDAYKLVDSNSCSGGFCIDRTDGSKPTNLTYMGNRIWNGNHNIKNVVDLGIPEVTANKTSFDKGDEIKLQAIIKNLGDYKTDGTIKIRFYVDGKEVDVEDVKNDIDFKQSVAVVSAPFTAPSDHFTVKAVIDTNASTYGDDNPSNNEQSVKLNGSAGTGVDLAVTQVKAVPEKKSYGFGDLITFEVTVKNQGNKDAPNGKVTGTFYLNGNVVDTVNKTLALAAGESKTFTTTDPKTVNGGLNIGFKMTGTFDETDTNPGNGSMFIHYPYEEGNANLVLNPGFESGDAKWSNWGWRQMVSEQPHTGNMAMKVGPNAGGGGQDIVLQPDTTYIFGAWGKFDGDAGQTDIGVQYTINGEKTQHAVSFTNSGEYEYKEVKFTTPADVPPANVFIWKSTNDTTFYADDLVLKKVKKSEEDTTPPVITYAGNAGEYTIDQTVAITCSVKDASDIVSSTCNDITGPAYSFKPGKNTFSATAKDKEGNKAKVDTSFTVKATSESISKLIDKFVTKHGVKKALQSKMKVANKHRKDKKRFAPLIQQLKAQSDKALTKEHADILIRWIKSLN